MTSPRRDIYTEPDADPDTLANLGPLRPLAGSWEGTSGIDRHPVEAGAETQAFVERYDLVPTDPQTNGPQLFYGLRYHVHIVRPGQVETFHDQVGYWLWEPATGTVIQTLAIPRAQVAMAAGPASPDARQFELRATGGSPSYGICSGPFLLESFRTTEFRIAVTIHDNDSWSYEEETVMDVVGRAEPFRHTDGNTLHRVAPPVPNPMAGPAT